MWPFGVSKKQVEKMFADFVAVHGLKEDTISMYDALFSGNKNLTDINVKDKIDYLVRRDEDSECKIRLLERYLGVRLLHDSEKKYYRKISKK